MNLTNSKSPTINQITILKYLSSTKYYIIYMVKVNTYKPNMVYR